jgi:hypothetical protein
MRGFMFWIDMTRNGLFIVFIEYFMDLNQIYLVMGTMKCYCKEDNFEDLAFVVWLAVQLAASAHPYLRQQRLVLL